MAKYIFIVGGVMSSVGKGVTTSSIAKLLQSKGYRVTLMKADPYINVDAGTMNPTEHGEVFVTDDGDETDQDLGNYERFLDTDISSANYLTTGRVYLSVIQAERNLAYGGKCVEVVPHIPEEIIRRIKLATKKTKAEITVFEVGGTVGEYQNILFLEAARMLKLKYPNDVLFVLVSYLPIPKRVGEMKTKPTQYAVRTLNSTGIQPDFIVCRGERSLDNVRREKLATFCNIAPANAIAAPDVESIYEVPLLFNRQKLGEKILAELNLGVRRRNLKDWKKLVKTIKTAKKVVKIGIVGKYFNIGQFVLADSYISVIEALKHAIWYFKAKPELTWLDAEEFEKNPRQLKSLKKFDGILIPGGFGSRGVEGKIKAIQFVRTNKIPYFGLCYGMQLACVEIARHLAGLKQANSTEINPKTPHPIIYANPFQQKNIKNKRYGGTMRLGAYDCKLEKNSLASKAYKQTKISERHRHRYEFNNAYKKRLEAVGVTFSGTNPQTGLAEIIELKNHPWFLATQFHPEFKSRPLRPHPLFREFIRACLV